MGATFALFFGFIVVLFGIGIIVFGIGGEVLFGILMVRGKRFGPPLLVVSAIIVRLGIVVALAPILFFVLIISANFFPPSNFVKTETAIEFTDDTRESFTADGVTYVRIDDIRYNWDTAHEIWTPVFHYIPDVAIERHNSFNCYSIPNDSGYELVATDFGLYCKAGDEDTVLDYYLNKSQRTYYFDTRYSELGSYEGEYYRLPSDVEDVLDELYSLDRESLELKEFTLYNEAPNSVNIHIVSEAKLLFTTTCGLIT